MWLLLKVIIVIPPAEAFAAPADWMDKKPCFVKLLETWKVSFTC